MKIHNAIRNHQLFESYDKPIMDLIRNGRARINGKVRRTNRDVVIARDLIEVDVEGDGEWVQLKPEINRTLIVMYKPVGYLCTHSDVYLRPIVYSLVPPQYQKLRGAGRLDQNSEGLYILSDDGYYLFDLTSPKIPCHKKYLVALNYPLPAAMIDEANSGTFTIYREGKAQVLLPAGIRAVDSTLCAEFEFLDLDQDLYWYEFTLSEGRYNQIRKMCLAYNNPVQRLIRIQQGDHRLTQEIVKNGLVVISEKT